MLASEIIKEIQRLVDKYGDTDVVMHCGEYESHIEGVDAGCYGENTYLCTNVSYENDNKILFYVFDEENG